MNKKGQGLASWYVDFVCVFLFFLAIILAVLVFQLTGVGEPKLADIEALESQLTHTHVLLGYLNSPIDTQEYGMLSVKEVIDLNSRDPGSWSRILQTYSNTYFADSRYTVFLDDEQPTAGSLAGGLAGLGRALVGLGRSLAGYQVLDSVPILTSNNQVVWVVLAGT